MEVSETASRAVIRAEDAAEWFPGLVLHDRHGLGFAIDEASAKPSVVVGQNVRVALEAPRNCLPKRGFRP